MLTGSTILLTGGTGSFGHTFGCRPGDYPNAEAYYAKCISLPLYPDLTEDDLAEIVRRLKGRL